MNCLASSVLTWWISIRAYRRFWRDHGRRAILAIGYFPSQWRHGCSVVGQQESDSMNIDLGTGKLPLEHYGS